ncbi:MAG: hypothetical protein FJ104_15785, partial [Deltaproteobacteria bacterium]|nr:hypothetical protein [Deltaproteobacteria bacterium]
VPTSGLLDPDAATNVVAGWDVVYVPYCDGSAFLGDSELADASMPGGTRHHRGIRNLSAAIDVALAKFPNPRRILLAGSSAGGYGTITGTGIVRLAYPKTPLIVFNDAGLGLDNPANPGSQIRKDEWKYMQFIPAGCEGCQEDQSLVPAWGLEHDPTLRLAAFSAYEDAVIGATFLGMTGPDFKALLLEKTGAIQALYPDRFRRFLVPGTSHTTLLADAGPSPNGSGIHGFLTVVEGQSVSEWTQAFVDGTAEWTDRLIGE